MYIYISAVWLSDPPRCYDNGNEQCELIGIRGAPVAFPSDNFYKKLLQLDNFCCLWAPI